MTDNTSLEYVTRFIRDAIVSGCKYDLGDLADIRCECADIIKNDKEKELLENINDLLFEMRTKLLTDTIYHVNYILRMTLYFNNNNKNKYENVEFLAENYQTFVVFPDKPALLFVRK